MPPTTHFAPRAGKLLGGSRLGSTPVISVTALAGVPAFVRHAFGDRLLRRANQAAMLDIEAIEDQDCFIPHITMTTFVDAVARFSGEEDFGLTGASSDNIELRLLGRLCARRAHARRGHRTGHRHDRLSQQG